MAKNKKIAIQGAEITILSQNSDDYISLTDMARSQLQDVVIIKWLSLKSTIEYLGEWESLYNPNFNYTEFGIIKNASGSNNFVLSVKQWIESTQAIGLTAKAGRYGGWNLQRTLVKVNYHIHTDAIKENLIPEKLSKKQVTFIYANEADVLNVALFGKTAKEWREGNPAAKGNIRDFASLEQLVVLSNMESVNAMLIHQGMEQPERLRQLNQLAITQIKSLIKHKDHTKKLK